MSLTAMYDPTTDRILNATPGTLTYRHEEGHRAGWKSGLDPQCQAWAVYALFFAVACLAFDLALAAKVTSAISLILFTIPEIHAWWYAFAKREVLA